MKKVARAAKPARAAVGAMRAISPGRKFRPDAGGPVFGDPKEGQDQRGEDGRDGHLGGHGQSDQGAQQYAVAGASAIEEAQHGPQAGQGRQYRERFRAVKVGVLNVNDGEGGEGGGQDAGPAPVHTAADDVEQTDGGNIGQGGEGAAGEAQFHHSPIDEGFEEGAQQDEGVDEGAAQGEPAGVERTAFGGEGSPEVWQAGLHTLELLAVQQGTQVGCRAIGAVGFGAGGEQAKHVAGAQVE